MINGSKTGRPKDFTSAWQRVINLSNLPSRDIAKELNVKHKYVLQVLRKEGIRKTHHRSPKVKTQSEYFTHSDYYKY